MIRAAWRPGRPEAGPGPAAEAVQGDAEQPGCLPFSASTEENGDRLPLAGWEGTVPERRRTRSHPAAEDLARQSDMVGKDAPIAAPAAEGDRSGAGTAH